MRSLFGNRNFLALFSGRLVTNAGDSLYFVAAMWLVYDLTGSEFYTGVAGFLVSLPAAFQFLVGPVVDRFPLRGLLVTTQLLQAALILTIPAAAATGHLSVWLLLTVIPVLSALNQLVYPAETAALPRVVDEDELVSANSLFAIAYQGVEAVFNGVAGLLLAVVGAMALFTFDAVTFAVAAGLFATLTVPPAGEEKPDSSGEPRDPADPGTPAANGGATTADAAGEPSAVEAYVADLREGIAYLQGTVLALMIGGAIVINFTLGVVLAALPAYGDLLGGPAAFGILTASTAAGTLLGALAAGRFEHVPFGKFGVVAWTASGLLWIAGIAVGWLPGTAALLLLALVPVGVTNVLVQTLVQTVVPPELLGRVSAVLGSSSAAAIPVGSLAGGTAASIAGPTAVMASAGGAYLVLVVYFLALPPLRRLPAVTDMDPIGAD